MLIENKMLVSIPEVEALLALGRAGVRAAYEVAAKVRLALALAARAAPSAPWAAPGLGQPLSPLAAWGRCTLTPTLPLPSP